MRRTSHSSFLDDNGFYWIHTPIITASDCEGAGELFRVSTLDLLNLPRKANTNAIDFRRTFWTRNILTVSGQLEAETYCLAMSKVYTFGPTFRAENSNTTKHLAEFWMIEPEIAFADLEDAAMLAENLLKYIFKTVLATYPDDMNFFVQHVDKEAVNRLQKFWMHRLFKWNIAMPFVRSKESMIDLNLKWHGAQICRPNTSVI